MMAFLLGYFYHSVDPSINSLKLFICLVVLPHLSLASLRMDNLGLVVQAIDKMRNDS